MGSLRLDLGVALFGGRLDPYGLHPYGLDPYGFHLTGPGGRRFRWPPGSLWLGSLWLRSLWVPSDWIWGSHSSVAAWIPMAWIPMASPQLDLGVGRFGGRQDPCGLDRYGFPPTGPGVARFGAAWICVAWIRLVWIPVASPHRTWRSHFSVAAWISMASLRLDLRVALVGGRLDP